MSLTVFYAQLFGSIMIVIALSLLTGRRMMLEVIREMIQNRALLFVVALISLFLGLLVVLTHSVWNGGAVALLITLLGWLFILRAVAILFLPHETLARVFKAVTFEQTYYLVSVLALAVGIYLALNGFTA